MDTISFLGGMALVALLWAMSRVELKGRDDDR